MISANAIAVRHGLFTVDMIARRFKVTTGVVRARIQTLNLKPVARICTGREGRPAAAFKEDQVVRLGRTLPRVVLL